MFLVSGAFETVFCLWGLQSRPIDLFAINPIKIFNYGIVLKSTFNRILDNKFSVISVPLIKNPIFS